MNVKQFLLAGLVGALVSCVPVKAQTEDKQALAQNPNAISANDYAVFGRDKNFVLLVRADLTKNWESLLNGKNIFQNNELAQKACAGVDFVLPEDWLRGHYFSPMQQAGVMLPRGSEKVYQYFLVSKNKEYFLYTGWGGEAYRYRVYCGNEVTK